MPRTFPCTRLGKRLTDAQRELVWNGCAHFKGIHAFFNMLEAKSYKIQNRVMISRYRGRTKCTDATAHESRTDATCSLAASPSTSRMTVRKRP